MSVITTHSSPNVYAPARQPTVRVPAHHPKEVFADAERAALMRRAADLMTRNDAVLVAHYYTPPSMQQLAEATGGCVSDSLEMARFGNRHPASTIMVAGVRFMGETAKILTPDKRVLMPNLDALCSLDIGCPPDEFARFRADHPERTVVVYANTSAAVKAQADWVVTSSIAVDVIEQLDADGERILWAPDKYLGDYLQKRTGADMLMWNGACVVHEEFKSQGLLAMRATHPDASVLAHPESPPDILSQADFIGSTSQIIEAAKRAESQTLIVATDQGLFHKLSQAAPDKRILIAPTFGEGASCQSCARCPWMSMNGLRPLVDMLECVDDGRATGLHEIRVGENDLVRARTALNRMLEFRAT